MAIHHAQRLLQEAEDEVDWDDIRSLPHPFDSPCGNDWGGILRYCVGPAAHKCFSCLGEAHAPAKSRTDAVVMRKCNDCHVALHNLSYCVVCRDLFPVDEIQDHVRLCFADLVTVAARTTINCDGFCSLQGASARNRLLFIARLHRSTTFFHSHPLRQLLRNVTSDAGAM